MSRVSEALRLAESGQLASLAKLIADLEVENVALREVVDAARLISCGEGAMCLGFGFVAVEDAIEQLDKLEGEK